MFFEISVFEVESYQNKNALVPMMLLCVLMDLESTFSLEDRLLYQLIWAYID